MRCTALCLASVLLVSALTACAPGSPPAADTQTPVPRQDVARPLASPTAPSGPPTAGGDTTPNPAEQPAQALREAISAREAMAAANGTAEARHADYRLYEILGCHQAGPYGRLQRDSHLVEGTCAQWLCYYVRPVDAHSAKGYHALFVRVGPNGVLETIEEAHADQVRKKPVGDPAEWRVDSPQAIAIAENDGGRAYRQANPQWDTSRFEADRNAIIKAALQFTPYWDSATGKEYAGTTGAVWVIAYPPLNALQFVIDAGTGEVLLAKTR